MASYTILSAARPGQPDADALVIGDRFSVLAVVFGGVWFLWHRAWFVGTMILLIDLAISIAAFSTGQWVLASGIDIALALLVGLEAQNWRLESALNKGFRVIDIVEASDAESAFEIHAVRQTMGSEGRPVRATPPGLPGASAKYHQAIARQSSMIGLVPSGAES